jgi:CHAT domain-containing protein/tetratricopeptide (TPR) repeat protein
MRKARQLLLAAALCLAGWAGSAQAALSGNDQVALAGRGAFDELAKGLQAQADSAAASLKVADWHALCYAYSRLKRYDQIGKCLNALEASLVARDKHTRLFGLDDATPTLHLMRAEAALELAQYETAVQQAQLALDWFKLEGDSERDIQVQGLALQAIAQKNLGQRQKADALLNDLRKVPANMLGDDTIGAKSLAQARVCMSLGYWQDALDALALDKSLPLRKFLDNLATGAFLRNENNWVWIELPRAYMENKALLELGERDRARNGYASMLKIPQIAANGEIHWMVLSDYGGLLEADKAYDQAIEAYGRALVIIESQRASINTEANKIGFIGDKQDVYAKLVTLLFNRGRFAEALEIVERSKSRALVDMLASKQRFGAPVTERGQGGNFSEALAEISQQDMAQREQSGQRVRSASAGAAAAQAAPARLPAELRGLVSVKSLKPAEIQALLSPDESLLAYFAHGKDMFVLLVQRDAITARKVESAELERDIRKLRAFISKELDVQPLLHSLYQRLIGPVADQLTTHRLTIVAHGPLHYLPFSALMVEDQYLVDRFVIRMLPSASVLQFLRPHGRADGAQSLVLGNPDLHKEALDLPGAQVEAESVAALLSRPTVLLRDKANKQAFTRLAPGARYVHVASHGEFDDRHPLQSSLLLSAPTLQEGRLTVSDMYELGLDAELVTLSACETGLGSVASGDDVVGLTRGLLYAGASSVVTSLWKVDDDSTRELMTQMYRNLRTQSPDEALRGAQLETRKQFDHPYYWAPFYLTGMH